jgi:hypothetical protein
VSYLGYSFRNIVCCMCSLGNIYIHTFLCVGTWIAIVVGRLFPSDESCSVSSVGCNQVKYDMVPDCCT